MEVNSVVTFLKIKLTEMSNSKTKMEMFSQLKPLIQKFQAKLALHQNQSKVRNSQMQKVQWQVILNE
jgi:hypothetical protein